MTAVRPFVRPRALRGGDRVALLTLASRCRREDVEAGADELRALGFEPVIVDPADNGTVPGYVAGSAASRAAHLRAALTDPSIAAVIATRGGYGSAQLLPYLDFAEIRQAGTLLIGYSDITSLLDVFTGRAGVITIHGPMAEGRLARGSLRTTATPSFAWSVSPGPLAWCRCQGLARYSRVRRPACCAAGR